MKNLLLNEKEMNQMELNKMEMIKKATFGSKIKKFGVSGLIAFTLIFSSLSGSTFATDAPLTGSAAALADSSYTLEELLTYAIQDEYAAKAEYAAIIDEFDTTKPFTNIIKSEDTHINLLLPLFEAYDIDVPVNDAADHVVLPATLNETYPIGVTAEINNIAMYNAFLSQDLPADVVSVFTYLRDASENHLASFEKQVDRSEGNFNQGSTIGNNSRFSTNEVSRGNPNRTSAKGFNRW